MSRPSQKQRILALLEDGQHHTTFELAHPDEGEEILYPVCRKEELEKQGYVIEGQRREGSQQKEWRLVSAPPARQDLDSPGSVPASAATGRDRPTSPSGVAVPPRRHRPRPCSSGSARATYRDDLFAQEEA